VNSQSQKRSRARRAARLFAALLSLTALSALMASAAFASSPIRVRFQTPDYVHPGLAWTGRVTLQNTSNTPLDGTVTVRYNLPPGFNPSGTPFGTLPISSCNTAGSTIECTGDVTGVQPDSIRLLVAEAIVEPALSGVLHGSAEIEGPAVGETIVEPLEITVGSAPFAVKSFGVGMEDGPSFSARQAGATPQDLDTTTTLLSEGYSNFDFPYAAIANGNAPSQSPREVVAHLPAGFIGDPAVSRPQCTAVQMSAVPPGPWPHCPVQSQVGVFYLPTSDVVPVWNVVPPPGYPAAFAFWYYSTTTYLLPRLRPGDYGIDVVVPRASSTLPLPSTELDLWGVPADSSHDYLRGLCVTFQPSGNACPSPAERLPFLRNPTSCTGEPLPWTIEMDSFQNPGTYIQGGTTTPAMEGCEKLPFDPGISLTPDEHGAHSPSGLAVNIEMPQGRSFNGLAEADLKAATVRLPKGVSLNPASADGLGSCSDAELRLGLEGPSDCPESSKLGTLKLTTPLLEDPVEGSVYLRSQASQDPASGDLYRLALELESDRYGIHIKLPGSLIVDPGTGQMTTSFGNLPQLPFESMRLHLKDGPRAPLTTPSTCGSYAAHAEFTGWNGKSVSFDPSFVVDQHCAPPHFDPGFEAGVSDPTAGAFSPFTLRVTRDSGMPNLSRIAATLPEGELAKLAGVPVCSDAQVAAKACPASSRIGRVTTAVGEGSSPLYLPQPGKAPTALYLAGPYKSAPYSILATVPAQSGPFDLGTVTVRSALRVDPVTTQVTVQSDPLPQIFGGIPVSYRDVRVEVDRPGFTLNPTDCEPQRVTATIGSIAGASAAVSDRFQVGDCAALGFKPKLSLSLAGEARRTGNPALTAVLRMPKANQANIAKTTVILPKTMFIDNAHISNPCTRVQFEARECPKSSILGRASAFSPLLDEPLRGPVYFRSNGGERELPDLVADLNGQIHITLVGFIDSVAAKGTETSRVRTRFLSIPDAPVSKFVLKMAGGERGLLENSADICRGKHRASVRMDAQNGRIADSRPLVRARCARRTSAS